MPGCAGFSHPRPGRGPLCQWLALAASRTFRWARLGSPGGRLLGAWLSALSLGAGAAPGPDVIQDAAGRPVSREVLLQRLADADFILLGEMHDNPAHHVIRGELLGALAGRVGSVVVEHLDQGRRLDPAQPLETALAQAGFARAAWRWPLHEPVFQAARQMGLPVLGGNLSRTDGRRLVQEGDAALAPEAARLLAAAPLVPDARARLDADLAQGHCGQLSARHLPAMRLAQEARDATLARTLLDAPRPAVLLAGNGHVRRDYGVPRLLASVRPPVRTVSVGFVEEGDSVPPGAYDLTWITPPAPRPDPCASLKLPEVPRS